MQQELKRESNMSQEPQLEKEILSQSITLWQYVAQYVPERQLSLTKHYMWLAVVFLTAQISMFYHIMQNNLEEALTNPPFIMSVISALAVFSLGIILSSGVWFKEPLLPFDSYCNVL